MKINDLFESELDEGPVGNFLAKGARGIAKGAGAVAGGIAGMGSAAKQGYQAGKAAVGAPTTNVAPGASSGAPTAPTTGSAPTTNVAPGASSGAPTAPTTGSAPGATAKGTADFGTIQRSIKTLSPKQKTALSSQLSGGKPAAPAAPDATASAPAAAAPSGPAPDQVVKLSSGENYKWLGQQWAEVDPATGQEVGGQMLPAGFQKSLTDLALKQQAAPAAPAAAAPPDLKVVNGGQQAAAESRDFKSKFLQILI